MFSQTVEYAMRAMLHLAAAPDRAQPAGDIAARTSVPHGYLSKIMRELVRAGLVSSQRGPRGGFLLARAPRDITMLDVVQIFDPLERITRCPLGKPGHTVLCPMHARLDSAIANVQNELRATTLLDIAHAAQSPLCEHAHPASPTVNGRPSPGHRPGSHLLPN